MKKPLIPQDERGTYPNTTSWAITELQISVLKFLREFTRWFCRHKYSGFFADSQTNTIKYYPCLKCGQRHTEQWN